MPSFDRHFEFTLCAEYLDDIGEYMEHEFGLPNDYHADQYLATDGPVTVDFSKKTLTRAMVATHLPDVCSTNAVYFKPVLRMIHDRYKDVEGVGYVAFRFYEWASYIVARYTNRRSNADLTDVLTLDLAPPFLAKFFTFSTTVGTLYRCRTTGEEFYVREN